jgi:hypothetical protein
MLYKLSVNMKRLDNKFKIIRLFDVVLKKLRCDVLCFVKDHTFFVIGMYQFSSLKLADIFYCLVWIHLHGRTYIV